MNLFPFYMDISDKTFLIVGGGAVAKEKIASLRRFTDNIIVVAKETDLDEGRVIRKQFEPSDLDQADFVIGATSDRKLNRQIAECCGQKGLPVNIVDDAALCTFFMPSMVKRGDLTVAISTNGTSPAYARRVREQIEKEILGNIADILLRMGELRKTVPKRIVEQGKRKRLYQEILAELIAGENGASDEEIERIIRKYE